jgi:hypothetical protein
MARARASLAALGALLIALTALAAPGATGLGGGGGVPGLAVPGHDPRAAPAGAEGRKKCLTPTGTARGAIRAASGTG